MSLWSFEIFQVQVKPFESILVEDVYRASLINKHSFNLLVTAPYNYDHGIIIVWMEAWVVFLKEGDFGFKGFLIAWVRDGGWAFYSKNLAWIPFASESSLPAFVEPSCNSIRVWDTNLSLPQFLGSFPLLDLGILETSSPWEIDLPKI